MHKTITENWEFEITVTKVNHPCRLGFEVGDKFHCQYECPTNFCPKTMSVLYALCEIIRSGGDYKLRGSQFSNEIGFICADSCIEFYLTAKQLDT